MSMALRHWLVLVGFAGRSSPGRTRAFSTDQTWSNRKVEARHVIAGRVR